MALYFYQAFSKNGKRVSGYLDASTLQSAKDQLIKMNLYPTSIEITNQYAPKTSFFKKIFRRKVSLKDRIFFTKQLSVLLKSGIPLLQALDLLSEQTEGTLKNIVIALRDGIKEGRSLAEGLQKFPEAFDSIYIQLVRAGEATGKLEVILDRLNEYLTRSEELKKKISGALRYPIIQLVVIFVVVSALLVVVIPSISGVFTEANIQLPIVTRIVLGISNIFRKYFLVLIVLIAILYLIYRAFKATPTGKYTIDNIKLKLPLVGYFTRGNAIVQFTRTFGMLLEGGVNLPEALDIVVRIIDNKVLADALEKAKENIIKQGKISQYLKETNIFPATAIYLINTGEQSGELGPMMISVAKYYEDDLSETADSLTSLLNPIMMIVIAVIVGFIVMAILLPIMKLTQSIGEQIK